MKLTAITRFKQGDLWTALRRLGWTQRELARRTGFQATAIGEVINLRKRPHEGMANAIQVALAEAGEYVDVLSIWPESFKGLEKGFKIEETREVELLGLENAMALMAPEESEQLQERIEMLQEAVQELPPRKRELIAELANGESNRETATKHHLSDQGARTAKNIALRDLRREMDKIKFRNDLVLVRPEGWRYPGAKVASQPGGDLSGLGLSGHAFNRLHDAGIKTIKELCERSVADLVGLYGIGVKSLGEIIESLAARRLSLATAGPGPLPTPLDSYWLAKVEAYKKEKNERRLYPLYRPQKPRPAPPEQLAKFGPHGHYSWELANDEK